MLLKAILQYIRKSEDLLQFRIIWLQRAEKVFYRFQKIFIFPINEEHV